MKKRHAPVYVLIMLLVLCCSSSSRGQAPSGSSESTSWIEVQNEPLRSFSATLNGEEKVEQLRDWAIISALVSTVPNGRSYRDILHRFVPLRLDYLSPLSSQRVGRTRWLPIPEGNMLVVLPEGTAGDLVQIGRLADEFWAVSGNMPERVSIFEYRVDVDGERLW